MLKIHTKAPKAIRQLQTDLNTLGIKVDVDGDFGLMTEKAVMQFQLNQKLPVDGVYGSRTEAALDKALRDSKRAPEESVDDDDADKPKADDPAPWMTWLKKRIGERETGKGGKRSNPWIVSLFNHTTLKGTRMAQSDQTAWCAATVSAALELNGRKSTHSATAASYDSFGEKCEPRYGAIITIKTKTGSHRHVTFFDHYDKRGNMVCLGGNQSDQLKFSTFAKSKMATCHWPHELLVEIKQS